MGFYFAFLISLFNARSKFLTFLAALPISVITGLRVDVGKDYSVYEDIFQGKIPVSGIDPAFLTFGHQVAEFDNTGRLGFLICSVITFLGYSIFINRFSPDKGLSLMLFLSVPIFYVSSLNTLLLSNVYDFISYIICK